MTTCSTKDGATGHRPFPPPRGGGVLSMVWHDLTFLHWRVEPGRIRRHLPEGVELELFAGEAWIGIIPFRMSRVGPRGLTRVPWLSHFPELNVRTYVTVDGVPGVWFFSLDAARRIAVRAARATFFLPYLDARMSVRRVGDTVEYSSRRTHRGEFPAEFRGASTPTSASFAADRGTLEDWLTNRYVLFSADAKGRIYRGDIDHGPWPLQAAGTRIDVNTMTDGLDVPLIGEPHVLLARRLAVIAWWRRQIL